MIIGIIPSRYSSTRFPGKPLADIQGKSMIQRVYESAKAVASLDKVIVATDDQRIIGHVQSFGGEAVLTSTHHRSGTERCFEAYTLLKAQYSELSDQDYIINIQGDEPFLHIGQIEELIGVLDGKVEIVSQMNKVDSAETLHDPKEAKIVINSAREALYFSRQAIPYLYNADPQVWHTQHHYWRQVGMYAYRANILQQIVQLPESDLEISESLEQLRWLQGGFKVQMVETNYESYCVDWPEDIERILRKFT